MKSSSLPDHPAPGALPAADRGVLFGIERVEATTAASPLRESQPVGSVAEAVDVVLTATDRLEQTDRSTVNLKLSVGGNDLAVRIEVRADEVRTTFRTDSTELHSALAQEWQVLRADREPRAFRLAEPIFAASQDSANSSLSDQASRHGHPGQRAPQPEFPAVRSLRMTGPAAAPDLVTPPAGVTSTSRLLHTLA